MKTKVQIKSIKPDLSVEGIVSFFKHYFGGLYQRVDSHHIFLYSGGLAFSLFICIIPLVLIIFAILGSILDSVSVENQINTFISTIIPYRQYAEYARKVIFTRIQEVVEYKTLAGIVGGFGLFFAASGLFSSMRTILNHIFVVKEDKHVVIGKLRDFGMVFLVLLFILLSIIVLPTLDILKNITYRFAVFNYFQFSSLEHFFFSLLSIAMIFGMFYVLYSFVPYAKLGRKIPAVSAFWATLLWETAKRVFGYYITNVASLDKIYGTYALIVVVAFWIYYSSIVFIIGAEIGQLYRERRGNGHSVVIQ